MICTVFLIPLLMIIIGGVFLIFPPKKPNWLIGYRTKRSMKDRSAWKKSNKYCCKLLLIFGLCELVLSILLFVLDCFFINFSETLLSVITMIQIIPMFIIMFLVEGKLSE